MTGEARVKLFKGSAMRDRAPLAGVALSEATVTFEDSATEYRQADASGFIAASSAAVSSLGKQLDGFYSRCAGSGAGRER